MVSARGVACGSVLVALAAWIGACSKDNNVSADNNVGSCSVESLPPGTCPPNFSPEILSQGTQCGADAGSDCKTVGSCTIKCVDPRPCLTEGAACGDDTAACCGKAEGTALCTSWKIPSGDRRVCSKKCTATADCPGSCCSEVNSGTAYECAPALYCDTFAVPRACLDCSNEKCPDQIAACNADPVCADCASGKMFPSSPECLGNSNLRAARGCGLRECTKACDL